MASQYPYSEYVSNTYLGKSKTVKGMTRSEVELLAAQQIAKWSEEEKRAREREAKRQAIEEGKAKAAELNMDLENKIKSIEGLLQKASCIDFWKLWESEVYDHREYGDFVYHEPPNMGDAIKAVGGIPNKSFLESFMKRKREIRESQEKLAQETYRKMLADYEEGKKEVFRQYQADKAEFYRKKEESNNVSYQLANSHPSDKAQFEKFAGVSLNLVSRYIFGQPKMAAALSPDGEILLVSIPVLSTDGIPSVREYRYVQSRNQIDEVGIKKADFTALYDTYVFSIAAFVFASLGEVFFSKGIGAIAVNIWVNGIDPKTGNDFTSCVLSVQASSEEVRSIDFSRVDPKECIRGLKGLYAGSLVSLTPVNPIVNFDKDDARFVESRDVLSELDPTQNLAIMDWQDFEHLIRQLFGNIFGSASGGEVKITRASRDAGVDAVAFDPDPIRGGKFVIQAKRYNNVVGVSAVRDLYGTMINEGAGKGILVTTSYFGKDSYDFAKDKPLQLIDGSQLLGLLEQYGYGQYNITLGTNGK